MLVLSFKVKFQLKIYLFYETKLQEEGLGNEKKRKKRCYMSVAQQVEGCQAKNLIWVQNWNRQFVINSRNHECFFSKKEEEEC